MYTYIFLAVNLTEWYIVRIETTCVFFITDAPNVFRLRHRDLNFLSMVDVESAAVYLLACIYRVFIVESEKRCSSVLCVDNSHVAMNSLDLEPFFFFLSQPFDNFYTSKVQIFRFLCQYGILMCTFSFLSTTVRKLNIVIFFIKPFWGWSQTRLRFSTFISTRIESGIVVYAYEILKISAIIF